VSRRRFRNRLTHFLQTVGKGISAPRTPAGPSFSESVGDDCQPTGRGLVKPEAFNHRNFVLKSVAHIAENVIDWPLSHAMTHSGDDKLQVLDGLLAFQLAAKGYLLERLPVTVERISGKCGRSAARARTATGLALISFSSPNQRYPPPAFIH